jgi:hypothetical protein
MTSIKNLSTALLMTAALVALPGCMKEEGPAEKAGKSLDNAAESVGEKVEDAGEAMQDAAQGDTKE